MIHELSRRLPRLRAIAGVAVASSVWSIAAMNIGRKTAMKRLRNSSRVTVSLRTLARGALESMRARLCHAALGSLRGVTHDEAIPWRTENPGRAGVGTSALGSEVTE